MIGAAVCWRRPREGRILLVSLLLLASTALVNPSFDADPNRPAGWDRAIGATTGTSNATSEIEIVEQDRPKGARAIRFRGKGATHRWPMLSQTVRVEPGQRVFFEVLGRCKALRREGNQFANANALLIFRDASGKRLGFHTSAVMSGDLDWTPLTATAIAPKGTATATVGVFASMSGSAWFDAARLSIVPASMETPEERRVALEVLAARLRTTYPFFGMGNRPGDAAWITRDDPGMGFVPLLRARLAELRDTHVWIDFKGVRLPTGPNNPRPPDWNLSAIVSRFDRTVLQKPHIIAGTIGDIGYVGIGSFVDARYEGVEDVLDELKGMRALILDVRFNGGGNEMNAQSLASRFATGEIVYALSEIRDPLRIGKFNRRSERRIGPRPGVKPDTRPVIVLQGPACVSSGEAFLLMMRAVGTAKTLGLPSRGSSGNPRPVELVPGELRVWTSTWRSLTPGGVPIEGVGVVPEIPFEADPEAYAKSDPTLEKALALLAK